MPPLPRILSGGHAPAPPMLSGGLPPAPPPIGAASSVLIVAFPRAVGACRIRVPSVRPTCGHTAPRAGLFVILCPGAMPPRPRRLIPRLDLIPFFPPICSGPLPQPFSVLSSARWARAASASLRAALTASHCPPRWLRCPPRPAGRTLPLCLGYAPHARINAPVGAGQPVPRRWRRFQSPRPARGTRKAPSRASRRLLPQGGRCASFPPFSPLDPSFSPFLLRG